MPMPCRRKRWSSLPYGVSKLASASASRSASLSIFDEMSTLIRFCASSAAPRCVKFTR